MSISHSSLNNNCDPDPLVSLSHFPSSLPPFYLPLVCCCCTLQFALAPYSKRSTDQVVLPSLFVGTHRPTEARGVLYNRRPSSGTYYIFRLFIPLLIYPGWLGGCLEVLVCRQHRLSGTLSNLSLCQCLLFCEVLGG